MASPGDQGQGLPPPTPGLLPGQVLWERSFCTIHSSRPCSSWQISSGLGTGHPVHGGRKKILDFCEHEHHLSTESGNSGCGREARRTLLPCIQNAESGPGNQRCVILPWSFIPSTKSKTNIPTIIMVKGLHSSNLSTSCIAKLK